MGRPSKFTTEIGDAIVKDVEAGNLFLNQIAEKYDLHPDTIKNWVSAGLEEDASPEHAAFATAYRRANALAAERTMTRIRKAAAPQKIRRTVETERTNSDGSVETSKTDEVRQDRGDWRAEAFYAERRWPLLYGSRRPGGPAGPPLAEDLDTAALQDAAETRPADLDELLAEPPPELEEALLRNADRIRAILDRR